MPRKPPLRFATATGAYLARPADRVGEGGSGTVYRAHEEETGAAAAVKVLDPGKATAEKRRRFKNEILFGVSAGHPHVVPVLAHGAVSVDGRDAAFYVMPLYDTTLRGLIARGVAPDAVVPLLAGLLDGVEAAHRAGVIHRDLKPENVLYDAARDALVVADFGIAHFEDEARFTAAVTRPGTRLANFEYAAPEQRVRGGMVDARADIYALGLMLNEMFTGQVPHGTAYRTVAAVAPAYAALDALVAAMLRQNPAERPASVGAVRAQLPPVAARDLLVTEPVRVVDTDTPGPHTLVLILNHAPTPEWKAAMQHVGGYRHYSGYDPRHMAIAGDRVTIQCDGRGGIHMADVARHYMEFLTLMEQAYPKALAQAAHEREMAARRSEQERAERDSRRREWNAHLGV